MSDDVNIMDFITIDSSDEEFQEQIHAFVCHLDHVQRAKANKANNPKSIIHSYCPNFLQFTFSPQKESDQESQQHNNLDKWTSSDVIAFIISLNPEYEIYRASLSTIFTKQNVKGTSLSLIREHHLKRFGISNPVHCSAIYSEIQQLVKKERENCINCTLIQRSHKVFVDLMDKLKLQKEQINFNKQMNPTCYARQIHKKLCSVWKMKCDQFKYSFDLYDKYQNFLNFIFSLDYYNYMSLINALFNFIMMRLNLFLMNVIELHYCYVISIIFGNFCNNALQYFILSTDTSYNMKHVMNFFIKTPYLLLHNLIFKTYNYGVLSRDRWIFRKHGFFLKCWCNWICDINCNGIKLPQDIYQITGIKSSWLENSRWFKLLNGQFYCLVSFAVFLYNQCDYCLVGHGHYSIELSGWYILIIILFVYGYLMSMSYRLWFSIVITMISDITLKRWFFMILLLLVLFIFGALWERIVGFGNIVLKYFVLFHYIAGLIILSGLTYYYGRGHDSINFYFNCYVRFRSVYLN